MQIQTLQFSIVIAGLDNNPTVLNPDFLRYNNIVPEEWAWQLAAPPISTPPFSQVVYNSGVTITVDPTKIQIIDKSSKPALANTQIVNIAVNYVNVLRHVAYSATGLNFIAYLPVEHPSEYIKNRFMLSGVWDTHDDPLSEVGLRFVYPMKEGKINLSIDSGEVDPLPDDENLNCSSPIESIVINANFHRDCLSTYPNKIDEILRHLNYASQDESKYQTLLNKILIT